MGGSGRYLRSLMNYYDIFFRFTYNHWLYLRSLKIKLIFI